MASNDKSAALLSLYGSVGPIAKKMGGASTVVGVPASFKSLTLDEPLTEDVPALHVEMPDGFRVEFTPSGPLNTPYPLSVNIRRIHRGAQKNSTSTTCVNCAWRTGQSPLSDDQIRAWLTIDGPPAA